MPRVLREAGRRAGWDDPELDIDNDLPPEILAREPA
jgi:hypothetical protein